MTNIKTNFKKKILALSASMAVSTATIPFVFAADEATSPGLETVITKGLKNVAKLVNGIFNPLCILALGICIVILVLGRNSKSAESSISWAKRIVICFIVFNILGTLMTFAGTIFEGSGFLDAMKVK